MLQTTCNVPAVLSEISGFPLVSKYSGILKGQNSATSSPVELLKKFSPSSYGEKMRWGRGWKFGKDRKISDWTDWSARTVQIVYRTLLSYSPQYRVWCLMQSQGYQFPFWSYEDPGILFRVFQPGSYCAFCHVIPNSIFVVQITISTSGKISRA